MDLGNTYESVLVHMAEKLVQTTNIKQKKEFAALRKLSVSRLVSIMA